jgi:hypothetical protein
MERRRESRSKRVERVEFGDRLPVKVGEHSSEKSMKKVVGVGFTRSVGE